MSQPPTQKLQQLLKRLGQAIHGSVVNSDEVQACLRELHEGGWDAVMLLDAAVACRTDGTIDVERAAMHVHAEPEPPKVSYRINREDAHLLGALGISPTRHRSQPPRIPRYTRDDQPDR